MAECVGNEEMFSLWKKEMDMMAGRIKVGSDSLGNPVGNLIPCGAEVTGGLRQQHCSLQEAE